MSSISNLEKYFKIHTEIGDSVLITRLSEAVNRDRALRPLSLSTSEPSTAAADAPV